MGLASGLGRFQYFKGKSAPYVEAFRSWVTPAAAAAAAGKYLGLPSRWALVLAVLVPLLIEALGFLLGRYLWERGGVETEYDLALQKDPFRRESLRLAAETAKEARAIRLRAAELCRRLLLPPRP